MNVAVPPSSPSEGQAWALGASPSGAWSGQAGKIATWRGGGWLFVGPRDGWMGWVRDVAELQVFSGGAWVTLAAANGQP